MSSAPHIDRRIGLAFAAIVLFLGINFVAVKFSNAELAPFWGAAMRFGVAAAVLFLITKAKKVPLPQGKALVGAVLFGVFAFGITYGLLYLALVGLNAAVASVILATIPLLTLLLATAAGLERITTKGIIGAALVIFGIAIVFREQAAFNVPAVYFVLAFGGALGGALSGVVVKYFPKSHPVATNTVAMAVGTVLLLVASLVAGESIKLPALGATWLALIWLIVSSICAFVLMVWVLSKWSASATSYAMVMAPLVTIVAAALLINEAITADFLVGSGVVLTGVYTSIFVRSKKAALRSATSRK